MDTVKPAITISPANLEFLNTRADVLLASRSLQLMPSVCWGMGCHVGPNGPRVTVWLARAQSVALQADIEATGAVAAVFSEPYTNFTLQIKGANARVRKAVKQDAARLQRHLEHMICEVGRVGLDEAFVRTAFAQPLSALIAVEFIGTSLFEQTPGPHAGRAL
jgi:hypothetical protein